MFLTGWGFSAKSREIIVGLRYKYTPKKALQTYSTGLWCNWSSYALKSDYAFAKDANDVVVSGAYPANASDKYSAMRIFSLSVPFFFTQRFGRTSDFRFTLGPAVNFNVYGRIYNDYTIGDNEFNISTKGFQYRPVTLDIMAMVSWRQLSVFCKYSPMSVLESDKGPQFRSVSVGLFLLTAESSGVRLLSWSVCPCRTQSIAVRFQLRSGFVYVVLVGFHFAHDGFQLRQRLFVFDILVHSFIFYLFAFLLFYLFTVDTIVPFSTLVSISSPGFNCCGSRTARPSFSVML